MPLTPGTRLGPYEVMSSLGAGGMGEVYRARDTKLNRDIAIKVLLPAVADDPERLARFSREAQLLASLNHPNIASIYGLEDAPSTGSGQAAGHALVMELVEGPTLAEIIERTSSGSGLWTLGSGKHQQERFSESLAPRAKSRSGLPVEEAVAVARQIVDALEAAHEQGIIHRDLKPANVKVKADGTVKVLDFGLAKALDPAAWSSADVMNSPTLTGHATRDGIILGTAAYMSPEQARGKTVDKRCDIWAFGCVLFEMLSGRLSFAGETISDTIAAVLSREPDWSQLPDRTPTSLRRLLQRCLEKDPKRRLRDIGDARFHLDEAQNGAADDTPVAQPASRRRERLAWMSALALVTLIAAVAMGWAVRRAPPARELRVEITTPPTRDTVSLAISPDGQKVVFVASSGARSLLWVRSLDSASAQPLAGTDGVGYPFWSPDSQSLGFFADGKLQRIDINGGSPTFMADAPYGRGGAWNRDGTVLFAPVPAAGIFQVPANGGTPVPVTRIEPPRQVGHGFPQWLPDSRHFLYYVDGATEAAGVYVGLLGSTETKRVLDADAPAVYAASGQLLFVRQRALFAQDFDPVRLTLTGNPFPVADQVVVQGPATALSASAAGPIVYRTGAATGPRRYVWFDRSGKEVGRVGDVDVAGQASPSLSPDGRTVALFRTASGNADVWLLDVARRVFNRFTEDGADDIFPIWSPDGGRIAFSSTRKGGLDLYLKSTNGTASEELLLATPQIKALSDWSADGRFLLYSSPDPRTQFDIWTLPLDKDRKPFLLVQTKYNERLAQFSPDGKWIAYESNESGRYEICIQRFAGVDGKSGGKVTTVSTTGGAQARWRRDGKALFYIALDDRLMEVPLRFGPEDQAVEVGTPVALFSTRAVGGALQVFPRHQYSVDGQRFLMLVEDDAPASPISLVLNWAGRRQ